MRTCNSEDQETCEVEKRGCIGCAYATADRMFKQLGYQVQTISQRNNVRKKTYN